MSVLEPSTAEKILFIALNVLLLILGVLGNAAVIYVFAWKYRGKSSRIEMLYLILAILDLSANAVFPVMLIVRAGKSNVTVDPSGTIPCKIMAEFLSISHMLSQVVLLMICVERYRAVVLPFAQKIRKRVLVLCFLGGIILGIALYLPMALSQDILCTGGIDPKTDKSTIDPIMYIAVGAVAVSKDVIVGLVMGFLIIKMYKVIQTSESNIQNYDSNINAKNRATARRMLVIMILMFWITTLPIVIYNFGVAISLGRANTESKKKQTLLYMQATTHLLCIYLISGTTNPIIYSRMHPKMIEFRKNIVNNLRRVIDFCGRKQPMNTSHDTA